MINLLLVWDLVCVGLQERMIVSGECSRSKIRRVSTRIAMRRPQDGRPLLLSGEEKAGIMVPSTPRNPILPPHRAIPRCHPQLAPSFCPQPDLLSHVKGPWGSAA